jgi:hypothetical protein
LKSIIVIENPKRWPLALKGATVVAAKDYLVGGEWPGRRGVRVYNFCRTYGYQTVGYYVSLLAAARGHRPLPTVRRSRTCASRPSCASSRSSSRT